MHSTLRRAIPWLAGAVICKTVVTVFWTFRDYFPPNFDSYFLSGRDAYFFGSYRWAFYAHIISGPLTLLLGLVLVNNSFRRRSSGWHRRLGKVQVALVLLLVVPGGLWMALKADGGPVAVAGFTSLAVATFATCFFGWRAAMARRFPSHERWMQRCYVLLCSAVVLRLIGGLATILEFDNSWSYPFAAWFSWLGPLLALEWWRRSFGTTRPASTDRYKRQ